MSYTLKTVLPTEAELHQEAPIYWAMTIDVIRESIFEWLLNLDCMEELAESMITLGSVNRMFRVWTGFWAPKQGTLYSPLCWRKLNGFMFCRTLTDRLDRWLRKLHEEGIDRYAVTLRPEHPLRDPENKYGVTMWMLVLMLNPPVWINLIRRIILMMGDTLRARNAVFAYLGEGAENLSDEEEAGDAHQFKESFWQRTEYNHGKGYYLKASPYTYNKVIQYPKRKRPYYSPNKESKKRKRSQKRTRHY